MSTSTQPLSNDARVPLSRVSLNSSLTNLILDSDPNQSSFLVVTNSTPSLYIDKFQNIGINTTSPTHQLDINSANGSCLRLVFNNTNNTAQFTVNNSGILTITPSGEEIQIPSSKNLNIKSHNGSTGLKLNDTLVTSSAAQLNYVNVTPGTVTASRALVVNATRDIGTIRNITSDGLLTSVGIASSGAVSITDTTTSTSTTTGALKVTGGVGIQGATYIGDTLSVASTISGTIATASQPNITSVGTLTSINVSSTSAPTIIAQSSSTSGLTTSSISSEYDISIRRNHTSNIAMGISFIVSANDIVPGGAMTFTRTGTNSAGDLLFSTKNTSGTLAEHLRIVSTGRIGIRTNAPDRQLEINASDGNCLRLSYNAASGSATTYLDQSISSTGTVTFNVAGSAPSLVLSGGNVSITSTTTSTSSTNGALVVSGGIGITNTTDATSSTNGGTFTTAGGMAIAKKLFVGSDVSITGNTSIAGNLTVSGTTTTVNTTNIVIKDNTFLLNAGPSGTGIDAGMLTERYQVDVDNGTGDVVNDTTKETYPITSAMTTTLVLPLGANTTNDYYKNWWIKMTSGACTNQVRKVIGYVGGTTRTLTLSSAFTTNTPSSSDTVNLYNKSMTSLVWQESSKQFITAFTSNDTSSAALTIIDYADLRTNQFTSQNINASGQVNISNNTTSSSSSTGALIITGGVGIGGALNVGGTISGTLATATQTNITSVGTLTSLTLSGAISGATTIGASGVVTLSNTTESTSTSTGTLLVSGGIGVTKSITVGGKLTLGGTATSAAAWGTTGIQSAHLATTYTDTSSSGTVTNVTMNSFAQPTLVASTATTYTNAATLYIANAPSASTNVTITNAYALFINSGKVLIGDTTASTSATTGALVVTGGLGVSGDIRTSADIYGTIKTASQPNITSIGTLTNLSTGSITLGGTLITATAADINSLAGGGQSTYLSGITEGTVSASKAMVVNSSKNISGLNDLSMTGAISGVTNITASGTISGTLASGAQTGITSVGTLSGLTVSGTSSISGVLSLTNTTESTSTSTGGLLVSGGIGITKSITVGGKLTLGGTATSAAAWGTTGIQSARLATTYTDTSSSGSTVYAIFNSFAQPTLAASNATTFSTCATVYIENGPNAGTNATITNSYALWTNGKIYTTDATPSSAVTSGALISAGGIGAGNITLGSSRSLASWGTSGPQFRTTSVTYTNNSTASNGTTAWLSINTFSKPTIAATNTNVTVTSGAVNLYIDSPPDEGTNMKFTRSYALFVLGNMYFGNSKNIRDWNMGVALHTNGGTITDVFTAGSSTISTFGRTYQFDSSTFAATNTSVTMTNAATVYIDNAPSNGTNMTITNAYSLYIAAGKILFNDSTASTTSTSGALVVTGGVGIGGALNVTGAISGAGLTGTSLTLSGAISGATTIGASGVVTLSANSSATSTTTGTLRVTGGVGISENIYVGGVLNVTGASTLSSLALAGAITGATNITASGTISGATLTGTLSTAAQANITSVGTLTSLTLSGAISGATTIGASGVVTLSANSSATSTTTGTLRITGGVGISENIYVGGVLNVTGASTLSSLALAGAITGATNITASGTISGATLTGTLSTAAQANITSVGTLTSLSLSGAITGATNITASGTISGATLTGTLSTAAQTNITSVGTLTSLTLSGAISGATTIGASGVVTLSANSSATSTTTGTLRITGGVGISENIYVGGLLNVTGTVTGGAGTFSSVALTGAITGATNITASGTISGATLTGTLSTAAQTNITSVGTLTSLTLSGAISGATTIGASGVVTLSANSSATSTTTGTLRITGGVGISENIYVGGLLNVTGTVTGGAGTFSSVALTGAITGATNITASGTISGATLTGTLSTAAQTNITSVGTLTSLTLSGAISGATTIGASGVVTLSANSSATSTTTGTLRVTGGVGISENIYVGGVLNVTGASTLSSLALAGAITGATNITASGTISGATLTGTLSTAAQTNITSVGTLTGLTSSGAISITDTTSSTSTTTGALVVSGGVGLAGSMYLGTTLAIGRSNRSSSAWGVNGIQLNTNASTYTDSSSTSGTVSSVVFNSFARPTLTTSAASSQITYTNSATVYIANSPTVSGTAPNLPTITNAYSLWIASGRTLLADATASSSTTSGALVVTGGIGIGGTSTFGDILSITDTTASTSTTTGALEISGGAGIVGSTFVGHTVAAGQTARTGLTSWLTSGIQFRTGAVSYTTTSTGTLATSVFNSFARPTLAAATAGTITTEAATVYIDNAPLAGTNMTITNPYALWIASGKTVLDDATASSSKTTGALIVAGGIGVSGTVTANSLEATSTSANTILTGSNTKFRFMSHSDNICYIQTGDTSATTGSSRDLFIGDYGKAVANLTSTNRKFIIKGGTVGTDADAGFVGIGTSVPDRQLEINNATGSCLRLTYNDDSGSATTYCDQTISSTGVLTLTAAGSAPGFIFTGGQMNINNGVLELNATPSAINYDFGIIGKRYQIAENASPTGDVVTDVATETYTASSYTTTTITLPSGASATTNAYQNWWVRILTATTGAGQVRKVASSNTSRVLTLATSMTLPTGTVTVGLYAKEYAGIIWDESEDMFAAVHTVTDTLTSNQYAITDYAPFRAGEIIVGSTNGVGPNELRFAGITNDGPLTHTVIAERVYGGTERSELLLFKGNDTATTEGPDRIRMRAAEIRFQTYTTAENYTQLSDNNDRLIITNDGNMTVTTGISIGTSATTNMVNFGSNGVVSIGKTNIVNSNHWLEVASGTNSRSAYFAGRVGIGISSSAYPLDVSGRIALTSDGYGLRHLATSGGAEIMTWASGAITGIGSLTNHEFRLYMNDQWALKCNTTRGEIENFLNTSSFKTTSDMRLKENIVNADLNICYNNIKNLRLVHYKWKDIVYEDSISYDKNRLGWLAQEVETVLPKSVSITNSYGIEDCKGINTDQIYTTLYGCVQKLINDKEELEEKVTELQNENTLLKQQIQSILQRLDNLESN